MKRNLDTGAEVYNNKVKKNQRHTTNKKPTMYKDIYKDISNISVCPTDLLQGNIKNRGPMSGCSMHSGLKIGFN